jgi:putative SOS response-associated peptidase YedK
MCGRFTLTTSDRHWLAQELGVPIEEIDTERYQPRFNIAPTDQHWLLRLRREDRELLPARWGLVNAGETDRRRATAQINARSESAARTPAYRGAFAHRRCAIPADGFFEWTGSAKARRPYRFRRSDGGLLLFAGLYEEWTPQHQPGGDTSVATPPESETTFTILTTEANATVGAIHDRMPVVLLDEAVDDWLFEGERDLDRLQALLRPAPDELLIATAVSSRVNSVRHDDPACLDPAAEQLSF